MLGGGADCSGGFVAFGKGDECVLKHSVPDGYGGCHRLTQLNTSMFPYHASRNNPAKC
jgi:hypothetical protein